MSIALTLRAWALIARTGDGTTTIALSPVIFTVPFDELDEPGRSLPNFIFPIRRQRVAHTDTVPGDERGPLISIEVISVEEEVDSGSHLLCGLYRLRDRRHNLIESHTIHRPLQIGQCPSFTVGVSQLCLVPYDHARRFGNPGARKGFPTESPSLWSTNDGWV